MQEITREQVEEYRKKAIDHVCAECGGRLSVCWGGAFGVNSYIVRCGNDINHKGIARHYQPGPYDIPGWNLSRLKRRYEGMTQEQTRALQKYEGVTSLTKDQAREILNQMFPGAEKATPAEFFKAIKLCEQYGLNPLMKHMFMVPFWNRDEKRNDYACVFGIGANRLIASRKHHWSFLDDTPRISTEEEEKKHYRQLDPNKLRAIAKVRDVDTGAEVTAWGEWNKYKKDKNGELVPNEPKGVEKGNSMENMVCIRAERKALDMLYPADMPPAEIPVVDQNYQPEIKVEESQPEPEGREIDPETGEIQDGEFSEQPEPASDSLVKELHQEYQLQWGQTKEQTVKDIKEAVKKRYGLDKPSQLSKAQAVEMMEITRKGEHL